MWTARDSKSGAKPAMTGLLEKCFHLRKTDFAPVGEGDGDKMGGNRNTWKKIFSTNAPVNRCQKKSK